MPIWVQFGPLGLMLQSIEDCLCNFFNTMRKHITLWVLPNFSMSVYKDERKDREQAFWFSFLIVVDHIHVFLFEQAVQVRLSLQIWRIIFRHKTKIPIRVKYLRHLINFPIKVFFVFRPNPFPPNVHKGLFKLLFAHTIWRIYFEKNT